ncbi:alpha/beta hydrolase [soil metagenome]
MFGTALMTLFGGAALYTVLSPRFNYRLYRWLLFHPYPYEPGADLPPRIENAEADEVYIPLRSGKKLHCWYYRVANATKLILFSHGNAGNLSSRNSILNLLTKTGASVFIYDYEGFGKSEGLPTIDGICENGLTVYDYLVDQLCIKPENLIVYGESLGTGVAMYLADEKPVGAVILQSGFSSLRTIAQESYPTLRAYPSFLFPTQQLDTLTLAKKPHPPLLIVHGVLDRVVPYSHAERIYKEATEPKQLLTLPDSGHTDICTTAPNEFLETVNDFLKRA